MTEVDDVEKPLLTPKLPRWWRVLPSLILLTTIANIDNLTLNGFIEYRYTIYYELNSSSTENAHELCLNASQMPHNNTPATLSTTTTLKYPSSTTLSPNEKIQESTARLNVYLSLAATLPAIFTSILLGSNCDRIGRKPLLALPYVGKCIRYAIMTAVTCYDLPNIWIIVAVMFDGLSGTISLNILSSFAFVTDCTDEKSRTVAITITDVCLGCTRLIPLLTMGVYLRQPHYFIAMIITLFLSVIGLFITIFLQPESNLNVKHLNIFQQLKRTEFRAVTKCFRVFFVKRKDHKQRSLIMLVSIHLLVITMLCGYIAMYYIYLYGAPFCLDSFGVSLNSAAQTGSIIFFTILFTSIASKRADHLILPFLGCFFYIIQLILFAVAKLNWLLYVAVAIGSIYYALIPVIRSRITKLVEPDEYAVVFILAGVFESGGYFAISAIVNEIYQESLVFYPGLVYFCIAVVGVIAMLFML